MWTWEQLEQHGVERSEHVVDSRVLNHIAARTGCYLGSPSIVRVDDRTLVATHDIFGGGSNWDRSQVFRSEDDGRTWAEVDAFDGQWWSTVFLHRGSLYLMGCNKEWGDVVIRRSDDGGRSWTVPTGPADGRLLTGARYHCSPAVLLRAKGRLWRAIEDAGPERRDFRAFVLSAPEDANLLDAASWRCTNSIHQDRSLLDGALLEWAEGNVVVGPDGRLVDVLRIFAWTLPQEKVALLEVSDDGCKLTFDPATGFADMPGGGKKVTIRQEPGTGRYIALTDHVPDPSGVGLGVRARNSLYLVSSPDLRHWEVGERLLYHPDDARHAFQYADWIFDGDDILFVSRTSADDAEGGAHNYHDSNYVTFHRLKSFRERL